MARLSHRVVYTYGECRIYNEQMEEKRIKQAFWIKKKLIVIETFLPVVPVRVA